MCAKKSQSIWLILQTLLLKVRTVSQRKKQIPGFTGSCARGVADGRAPIAKVSCWKFSVSSEGVGRAAAGGSASGRAGRRSSSINASARESWPRAA